MVERRGKEISFPQRLSEIRKDEPRLKGPTHGSYLPVGRHGALDAVLNSHRTRRQPGCRPIRSSTVLTVASCGRGRSGAHAAESGCMGPSTGAGHCWGRLASLLALEAAAAAARGVMVGAAAPTISDSVKLVALQCAVEFATQPALASQTLPLPSMAIA